jgi:hypothetical protein
MIYFVMPDTSSSSSIKKIKLLDKKSIENLKRDLFIIKNLDIEDNVLYIQGTYTGGCHDDHLFELAVDDDFQDKDLDKINMILSHDSNGDDCKKIVRKSLVFDLQPLRRNYKNLPAKKTDTLILDLMGNTIKYSFNSQR